MQILQTVAERRLESHVEKYIFLKICPLHVQQKKNKRLCKFCNYLLKVLLTLRVLALPRSELMQLHIGAEHFRNDIVQFMVN